MVGGTPEHSGALSPDEERIWDALTGDVEKAPSRPPKDPEMEAFEALFRSGQPTDDAGDKEAEGI